MKQNPKHNFAWTYSRDISLPDHPSPQGSHLGTVGCAASAAQHHAHLPRPFASSNQSLSASLCHEHIDISTFGQEVWVQDNYLHHLTCGYNWLELVGLPEQGTEDVTRICTGIWNLTPFGKCMRLPRTVFSCSKTQAPTSSNTPQFSFSWKPNLTASNMGLPSSHYQKKMREAEEFVWIFEPVSELIQQDSGFVKLYHKLVT